MGLRSVAFTRLDRGTIPWIAVLLGGVALSIASFIQLRSFEAERAAASFEAEADDRIGTLETNIRLTVDKLRAAAAFLETSENTDREHFHRFAAAVMQDDGAVQAIEWIPHVTRSQRAAYEQALHREGSEVSGIRERSAEGEMIAAGDREDYFPVDLIEPLRGNEKALQFDLASDPMRREALERAGRTGEMFATGRVVLLQEAGGQFGVLLFRPVYRADWKAAPDSDWRSGIAGFALGVFRIGDLLVSAGAEEHTNGGIDVAIFDESASGAERLLYPRVAAGKWTSGSEIRSAQRHEHALDFGGRRWKIVAYSSAGAFLPERWGSGTALAGGLLLSVLLSAYLQQGSRRRIDVEDMVEARTAELRRAQAELLAAKEAAEAGSRAKSSFLATVSHELRTPMNGVIGYAELLMLPGSSAQEQEEYVRTIISSSKTLLALLDDILDLSKIEAGKLRMSSQPLDLAREIQEVAKLFGEPARRKGLRLDAQWKGKPGRSYLGDPIRVRQILSNLVSNAVKFTVSGSIHIEASEIEAGDESALVELVVRDTGIGIAPEKIELLFKPFSQVGEFDEATTKGTGLGLSIVRRLALLMGGDAGVESRPGEGSRFWVRIRLPLATPDSLLDSPSRFAMNEGRSPLVF